MNPTESLPIVTVKPRKALPFFSRHPWMYASAIQSVSGSLQLGDEVAVRSHDGQFIGYGLYNPSSKIRVRLYSWDENQRLDSQLWKERIQSAIGLRARLFKESPAQRACRMIFSESDSLSGLTVDRFGDWLAVQWTSSALQTRQNDIFEILQQELNPQGIWLRTEKGIRELEGLDIGDGLLVGDPPPRPLFVEENGVQFGVDLHEGQKTGFYFDQRDNRRIVRDLASDASVLDVCTYSGSFAINAAKNERCRQVHAIDSSASALELAKRNAELNGVAHKIQFEQDEMFNALTRLKETEQKYDLVILDPPKMARSRGGLQRAVEGYIRLNRMGMDVLRSGGFLVTCSCSGHVSREDFEQIIAEAGLEARKTVQILEQRGQASDHPVIASCLETSYLKCFVCRVE